MKQRLKSLNENKEAYGTLDYEGGEQIKNLGGKGLNFQVDFENLLKLKLGLEAAALELNKYNKNQLRSKKIAVNLFFTGEGRITITIA